jgi:RHS repeat-associated protein
MPGVGVTMTDIWNLRNQLTGISKTGLTASFTYDSFGRRSGKTLNGTTTNYVYDGLNPVQEKNGATVNANLLTGLGIDEFFTRTDGVGVRSLLPDALGSTVALGDNTGTLQTQYTYEPFGVTTQTGAASTSSYKYMGREDDGTGLFYYRARYYQPRFQRFIAEDPIGFLGGDWDLYVYTGNNPTNLTDPSGHIAGQILGGTFGAAYAFYNAYNTPGVSTSQIIQSTAVGFGTGVLSSFTFGLHPAVAGVIFGGAAGALSNILTQSIFPSSCSKVVDPQSLAGSIIAGMVGGFAGGAVATLSSPLSSRGVPLFTDFGVNVISSSVAGALAGYLDLYFQGQVQQGLTRGNLQGSGP